MKNDELVHIRPMQPGDLPAALGLVESVGWNQTERDLRVFLEGPHNLYLVAEVAGRVVGTVASIHYSGQVAWISMMIVAEAFRGKGISRMLLNEIIRRLQNRSYRSIKLDATPAGRPVYQKLGFREEYEILRLIHHRWPGAGPLLPGLNVRGMTEDDLPAVRQLDRNIFGADRMMLLERLMEEGAGHVVEREARVVAYAFGRQGRRYFQIGPVGGMGWENIRNLSLSALRDQVGKAIVIDVLADKQRTKDWLFSLGFQVQRPFYRMFLQPETVPGQISDHYFIAGPEFG